MVSNRTCPHALHGQHYAHPGQESSHTHASAHIATSGPQYYDIRNHHPFRESRFELLAVSIPVRPIIYTLIMVT